ncbi:hypothetical protein RHSP_26621 [Rhizobium freirei PRF 81]|uniref:Uncharacterized protein n=1 Tax=Rhizobium freirei PRF 81 TaxID=363754 RepID=N6V0B3_9HYPH|nr:hypothetical protein RHSP_26621 [Rhizobium freirei PRF 81]
MAGIVHARRHFIGDQATVGEHEELDADHPDIAERRQDLFRGHEGSRGRLLRNSCRQRRRMEDTVAMDVFSRIIAGDRSVDAACRNNRNLALEGYEAFENKRYAAQGRIAAIGAVRGGAVDALALAVITEAPGLQYALAAEIGKGCFEIGLTVDSTEAGRRNAAIIDEALLGQPVLRHLERFWRRIDVDILGELLGSMDRNVLEFVCHDIAAFRQIGKGGRIVIGGGDLLAGDLRCWTIGLRFEDDGAEIQASSRHGEHAAELAAADDADRLFGHRSSIGYSATPALCRARHSSSRSAISSSLSARTAAARRAAFTAPALPIANVPTGIPAGICTMESRLSCPESARDCTGTPKTGSGVMDAAMPGRWAAPPAPAMMTLKPSSLAPLAKLTSLSGVRCAEMMRAS